MKRFLGVTLLSSSILFPTLSHANQIAQFSGPNSSDFIFTIIGTTQSLTATSQISFTFGSTADTPFGDSAIPATLVLDATSPVGDMGDGTPNSHGDFSGSFTITDNSLGTTLLSGNFAASGILGGSPLDQTAVFAANQATFTSDYLNFSSASPQTFSFNLSNLTPYFGDPGYLPVGADGLGNGSFSGDASPASPVASSGAPAPASASASPAVPGESVDPPVPEPMTLLMSGGALVGLSFLLRVRKQRP